VNRARPGAPELVQRPRSWRPVRRLALHIFQTRQCAQSDAAFFIRLQRDVLLPVEIAMLEIEDDLLLRERFAILA
jgi:hypothetical protein